MAEGEDYLAVALELMRRAEKETDPVKRAELETLAEDYRAKAEEARKGGLTIEFEYPPDEPTKH